MGGQTLNDDNVQTLERMMKAYGTTLLRTCYANLLDWSLAEDAAQDTFIKAYKSLSGLRAEHISSEKAWLMRIAINTCRDYRRSAWFRHVDRKVSPEKLPIPEKEIDYELNLLADAILALPKRLREVVSLVYYQRCTYEETADILAISRSAVQSRLRKAKAQLHDALEGWEL